MDVAQFRQQIEEINLIGVTDIEGILAADTIAPTDRCMHFLLLFPPTPKKRLPQSDTSLPKAPKQLSILHQRGMAFGVLATVIAWVTSYPVNSNP